MPSFITVLEQRQRSLEFTSPSQCQPIYSPLASTLAGTKFDEQDVSPAMSTGISHRSLNTHAPNVYKNEMGDWLACY
jgi:hypothetical protein